MGIAERKERERQHRRDMIIDAAEKIFFSFGLYLATVDDIAEQAELSKGTIYLYFKNKEDLYLAVTGRGLKIMLEMFKEAVQEPKLGIDKVRAIGNAYYEFSKKHPDYFKALLYFDVNISEATDETSSARTCQFLGEEASRIFAETIQIGVNDGSVRQDIDPNLTAILLWGMSSGIIQLLSTKGKHLKEKHHLAIDMDEMVEYAYAFIRESLSPQKKGVKK